MLLKGQSGGDHLRGEHIYHERKDLKEKFWFTKNIILTRQYHAHRGVRIFELYD